MYRHPHSKPLRQGRRTYWRYVARYPSQPFPKSLIVSVTVSIMPAAKRRYSGTRIQKHNLSIFFASDTHLTLNSQQESRIGGDVRNSVFGIVGGWEEVITPLELTLELYDQRDNLVGDTFKAIAEKYKPLAGNPDRVTIFSPDEVDAIVEAAANTPLDQSLLTTAYNDAKAYVEAQQKK